MENNQCFRCVFFSRYYTKGVRNFNRTKLGWCTVKRDTVKSDGNCDRYDSKPYMGKPSKSIWRALSDLLTQISEIRAIIEEDKNESGERKDL